MFDNIKIIVLAVVAGLVVVALQPYGPRIRYWIAWRWRRHRYGREERRVQREQYLNESVELTTGELVHRGCAGSKDEIVEPKPESTEGGPWGQPLKKREGAP